MNNEITNLNKMLRSEQYQIYEGETLFNPQTHMIGYSDINVDYMIECQENGNFGVSHSDFINCWRDYLSNCLDNLPEDIQENIEKEIDDCENWHEKNGSLYDII